MSHPVHRCIHTTIRTSLKYNEEKKKGRTVFDPASFVNRKIFGLLHSHLDRIEPGAIRIAICVTIDSKIKIIYTHGQCTIEDFYI